MILLAPSDTDLVIQLVTTRSLETFKMSAPSSWSSSLLTRRCVNSVIDRKSWSYPCSGVFRPWGFQEVEASRFQDSQHMKVLRSAVPTSRLYPSGNIPGTHFGYSLSRPRGHTAAGRIMSMTLSVLKPATFRLVAQCLNQLRHLVAPPPLPSRWKRVIKCSKNQLSMKFVIKAVMSVKTVTHVLLRHFCSELLGTCPCITLRPPENGAARWREVKVRDGSCKQVQGYPRTGKVPLRHTRTE